MAVNGDANSFALCPTSNSTGAQVNVVYKPQQGNAEYVYEKCSAVVLQMLGLY